MAVRAAPLLLPTLIAASAGFLPRGAQWIAALAAIVLLGIPHGALDLAIGRVLFRPSRGRLWFLVFALPYLVLAGAVLLAWRVAPMPTLAAFLLASSWHFGREHLDALRLPARPAATWALGGIPVAVPVLTQPAATARLLSAIAGAPIARPPGWLLAGALVWAGLCAFAAWRARSAAPTVPGLACLWFALLPPILAFALYFTALHAPAHMTSMLRRPDRLPQARTVAAAWRLALPGTAITLALGALLWPLYAGPAPARLAELVFQGLAALTLPHMLLDWWLERRMPATPVAPG